MCPIITKEKSSRYSTNLPFIKIRSLHSTTTYFFSILYPSFNKFPESPSPRGGGDVLEWIAYGRVG
jgi:hypothetical protein